MNKLQKLTAAAGLASEGECISIKFSESGAATRDGGGLTLSAPDPGAAVLARSSSDKISAAKSSADKSGITMPGAAASRPKPRSIARNVRVFSMRRREELVGHVMSLLEREGSALQLGVDMTKLRAFVEACSHLYHANAYHNWHHASDVTHTMSWMVTRPVLRASIPAVDAFWLQIAAIAHDLDHPGHNNQWEINIHSPRATKYNNLAVLEHHSLDLAADLMARPESAFAEHMSPADRERGKVLMRELILATDFAIHKDFLTAFSAATADYPAKHNFSDPAFTLLVLKALIKGADIANTTKPFAQAKMWGLRVMEEFWAQGRMEKAQAFPVGPLNDEERVDLNQAQAGFIRFAALDLFDYLSRIEPSLKALVKSLNDNVTLYQSVPPKLTPSPAASSSSAGGATSAAPRSAKP
jgi:hypothetical protein